MMPKEIINFHDRRAELESHLAIKPTVDCQQTLDFLNEGRVEEALDQFEKLTSTHTEDATIWCNLGFALGDRGLVREAIKAYRKALEIDAYFHNARYNLALELISLNESTEAEKELKYITDLSPNDAEAHFELARLYEERRLYDFALHQYDKVFKIKPQFRLINFCRANILFKLKNYSKSLEAYRLELDINPGFTEVHQMIKMVEDALLKKGTSKNKGKRS